MRRLFSSVLLALLLASCGGRQPSAPSVSDDGREPSPAAAVAADSSAVAVAEVSRRVSEIYDAVFRAYNACQDTDDAPGGAAFDRKYLSRAFYAAYSRTGDAEGFVDGDHWIMGQDWHDLAYAISDARLLSPSKARVTVEVTNLGDVQTVELEMVKEGEKWMIDDFVTLNDGERYSERAQLSACTDL